MWLANQVHLRLSNLLKLNPRPLDLVSVDRLTRQLRIQIPNDGQAVTATFVDTRLFNIVICILQKAGFQVKVRESSIETYGTVQSPTLSFDLNPVEEPRSCSAGPVMGYLDTQWPKTPPITGPLDSHNAFDTGYRTSGLLNSPEMSWFTRNNAVSQEEGSFTDGSSQPFHPRLSAHRDMSLHTAGSYTHGQVDMTTVSMNPYDVFGKPPMDLHRPRISSPLRRSVPSQHSLLPVIDPDLRASQPLKSDLKNLPSPRTLPFSTSKETKMKTTDLRTKYPPLIDSHESEQEQQPTVSEQPRLVRASSAGTSTSSPPRRSSRTTKSNTKVDKKSVSEKQVFPAKTESPTRRSSRVRKPTVKLRDTQDPIQEVISPKLSPSKYIASPAISHRSSTGSPPTKVQAEKTKKRTLQDPKSEKPKKHCADAGVTKTQPCLTEIPGFSSAGTQTKLLDQIPTVILTSDCLLQELNDITSALLDQYEVDIAGGADASMYAKYYKERIDGARLHFYSMMIGEEG